MTHGDRLNSVCLICNFVEGTVVDGYSKHQIFIRSVSARGVEVV